jgi:hypothetical protein
MKTIKFVITKHGVKRAYIWAPRAYRWLPISVAQAEFLLANDSLTELKEEVSI